MWYYPVRTEATVLNFFLPKVALRQSESRLYENTEEELITLINKALNNIYTHQDIILKVSLFILSVCPSPTHSLCFSLWNDFEMFSNRIIHYQLYSI